MNLTDTVKSLQSQIALLRTEGKSIGFVPTMGALHEGHLSLVSRCLSDNDVCVVSIFVNPTQFNDKEDLKKYPRNIEQDIQLLSTLSDNIIVFNPSEKEVYPDPNTRRFNLGRMDKVWEVNFVPGHSKGVAQLVSGRLDILNPNRAYLGEKDLVLLNI